MRKFLCLCMVCLWSTIGYAKEDFETWKATFQQEALKEGILQETLDAYMPLMQYQPEVVRLDKHQPEFKQTLCQYLRARLSETRLKKVPDVFEQHRQILQRVESTYQVPAHYLLALWGLETNFGATKGQFALLSSLATLAHDTRRSTFFKKQLIALLRILQEEKIEPPKGSWAGAFGHFQFMPTTFLNYAVDFNGDHKRDTYVNKEDAIASAANYLASMGWDPKTRWGRVVVLPKDFDNKLVGEKRSLAFWAKSGVLPKGVKSWDIAGLEDLAAVLLAPWGVQHPAFLLYPNFFVIKKWNHSNWYALSVGLMSDMIAHRNVFQLKDCENLVESGQTSTKENKT